MPFNPLEEIVCNQTEGQFVFSLVDRLQQRPGTEQTPAAQTYSKMYSFELFIYVLVKPPLL